MRLLLDESVSVGLRRSLQAHQVTTVGEMGWSGVKNGRLLALAAASFDAFITVDKNLQHQQNIATLPVSVILLDTYSNELAVLLPLIPSLERTLSSLAHKTFVRVTSGA